MNTLTLKRIRRLLQRANLIPNYNETPLYAIEMLVYIALYQHDHPIHGDELQSALKLKPDKVFRAIRKHLTPYVYAVNGRKDGVKAPVRAFYLTPKGEEYIRNLVAEYEGDIHNAENR